MVWGVMERGEMEWWEDGMLPGGVGELVTVVYAVLFDQRLVVNQIIVHDAV